MRKINVLLIMFLMIFTPVIGVNNISSASSEIPKDFIKEISEVENGPINESSAFANVVVFVKFSDEGSYVAPYNYDYYEGMFNDDLGVSLKNYYQEVSYNQLTIESYIANDGTTMIYYQDINDRDFYQPYDATTNPDGYNDDSSGNTQGDREHALLKRAIDYIELNNLISDDINLDVNDDGDIDSITFMVSGEDDGWNSLFWPHKWELSSYYNFGTGSYYSDAPLINGKYAYTYTFELLGNSTSYDYKVDVGVLAHETFHLISAPDLYHYYRDDFISPAGDWGLMDGTSTIPSHMLGYMKEMYGTWITDVQSITSTGTYTLAPLKDSEDNLYKIDLGYSNEYLYLEYRLSDGLYESNLPNSGLIVYRVDNDYFDDGNVEGYYDESGNPADELFIFRPGIDESQIPIVFPSEDHHSKDEDGDIDNAALSNNNLYDAMGYGTDIVMFYSDGSLINIKIDNVIEHDGLITFDVILPPRIDIVSEVEIPANTELYLFDGTGFEYRATLANLPNNALAYYTLDGSTPTQSSTLYTGNNIAFDASTNQISFSVYIDGILQSTVSREFNFVSSIETNHFPYNDYQNVTWYLDLKNDLDTFDLDFSSSSFLEDTYDYVYISNESNTWNYTGNALSSLEFLNNKDLVIHFESDETESNYYGFDITIDIAVGVTFELNGNSEVNIPIFDTYIEQGTTIVGDNTTNYTVNTTGTVDTDNLGVYLVTYELLDPSENVIQTLTRTINIEDNESPSATLKAGVDTIYVGGAFVDGLVEVTDNYSETFNITVNSDVNPNLAGYYTVEYIIEDESFNRVTVYRYVSVLEPEMKVDFVFSKAVTTILVGESFTQADCKATSSLSDEEYSCSIDLTNVNLNQSGTYEILYYIEIDDVRYEKTSYVFVYNNSDLVVWYYDKSRRGYL